jgi:hypothetical protein
MKIKFITLLSFLLLIALQSFGQLDSEKYLYFRKIQTYRKMKNTGAMLTLLGVTAIVVGDVIANNQPPYTGPGKAPSNIFNESNLWKGGGIVSLGVGIPLLIIGGANQIRYEKKLDNLLIRVNASQTITGITVTYRF